MPLYDKIYLINILIAHILIVISLALLGWKFFLACRAGKNGVTKGLLIIVMSFLSTELWSIAVAANSLFSLNVEATAIRFFRAITLDIILVAIGVFLYQVLTAEPEPELEPDPPSDD